MSIDHVIYIASVGYSGSTLLEFQLGLHPEVISLGEVTLLNRYLEEGANCTCGQKVSECEFWQSVEKDLKNKRGEHFSLKDFHLTPQNTKQAIDRSLPRIHDFGLVIGSRAIWKICTTLDSQSEEYATSASNTIDVFNSIANVSGKKFIVDSTKYALPMKAQHMQLGPRQKIIFLARDGRGTCRSLMRRKGFSMVEAANHWLRYNKNLKLAMMTVPNNKIYNLKYEDLCTNTEKVVEEIRNFCDMADIAMHSSMEKDSFHSIGGNPMRFRRDEKTVALDEKWKTELTQQDLVTFERIAGKFNRSLGYE